MADPPHAYLAGDTSGAFVTLWNEQSFHRARDLLARVLRCAGHADAPLYLFWGTLLGHVREGRMLPWDDDIDLALFQPGKLEALQLALIRDGLRIHERSDGGDFWLKVFDPAYPVTSDHGWTYPFLDIFVYTLAEAKEGFGYKIEGSERDWHVRRFPTRDILPGRMVLFEGQRCLEPQWPMALLDRQYPGWRRSEQSPGWDHINEIRQDVQQQREILTDSRGRKQPQVSKAEPRD